MSVAIEVEGLSKRYRLGLTHSKSLRDLANQTAARVASRVMRRANESATASGQQSPSSEFWALRDVSFTVPAGQVIGVIGRNGAGKSTLLKILSRITRPTTGRAVLRGRVASLLEVGTGFHPELTGRENVYLNGTLLGMTKQEVTDRFDEIVEFSGIAKFIDTPTKRYSSGMTVRLGFAIAAHLQPEILIVDEVLAVGDTEFQAKCMGKMGSVAATGRTVFLVSHNLAAIAKMCSRVLWIDGGRLRMDGTGVDVVSQYRQLEQVPLSECGVNHPRVEREAAALEPDMRITDLAVSSPSGRGLGELRTGDPLCVRIGYETRHRFSSPGFMFSLQDSGGEELFRVSTTPISGYVIESVAGAGSVTLTIPRLPIAAGEYDITVGIARTNVGFHQLLNQIAKIRIVPTDYYGSGVFAERRRTGLMVIDHAWDHSPRINGGA